MQRWYTLAAHQGHAAAQFIECKVGYVMIADVGYVMSADVESVQEVQFALVLTLVCHQKAGGRWATAQGATIFSLVMTTFGELVLGCAVLHEWLAKAPLEQAGPRVDGVKLTQLVSSAHCSHSIALFIAHS